MSRLSLRKVAPNREDMAAQLALMAEAVVLGYRKLINLVFHGYLPDPVKVLALDNVYGRCSFEGLKKMVRDAGETPIREYPDKGVLVTDKGVWFYNCKCNGVDTVRHLYELNKAYWEGGLRAVDEQAQSIDCESDEASDCADDP